ncbi:unnamed protein product [Spirodela intermedia]|uniref:Uncharacterized protein n=1 Tax=Spirodela intermedia TaxID=51605 RepID=A0A7I8JCT1_SPIIN|nr:unnamed protein product [Spirodela intermedia]CAA6667323.1 unnamed protein product [Spirodela intermedia]
MLRNHLQQQTMIFQLSLSAQNRNQWRICKEDVTRTSLEYSPTQVTEMTCPKRWHSTKKNVKDHACTPYVNFRSVVSFQDLWRHVVRATHNLKSSVVIPGLNITESPKSMTFSGDVSFLLANKKFSGLRSRWITPCLAPSDDAVEEFPSLAQLHYEVNSAVVLVRILEAYDVGVARQMPHDVHLPPHIFDIDGCPELLLRDGLAGEGLPQGPVCAEVSNAEFASPQLPPEVVPLPDVPSRGIPQHGDLAARAGVLL